VTVDDKHEADVVWTYDMMKDLGISQHNMCSCSVTGAGDLLFVNTANGVDASHINIPAPDAASFFAINKKTGKVLWTDNSPGLNILHGQWSSPAYAEFKDGPQVIFAGGDGWVYSFDPRGTDEGKSKLLWKFDCNPKESKWELQGKGTRNNIIATPVVHEGRIYVAVGQDPEHREGEGHLWCIDPTKRGDVSSEIVILRDEADRPAAERTKIPHRRLQALDVSQGEVAIANPNSAMIWHYAGYDKNGNKKLEFEEEMHRSCGTVAIKDNLLFIADFSGLFHCLDVKTGKVHWTYDMLAEAWGSPLITDGKVYIGDADGDIAVFKLSADPEVAMPDGEPIVENNMVNSVYTTPVLAHNVLYIANRNNLFAIEAPRQVSEEKKNE
jgi:outer membrane protein assembly factor BamB